jgi:hypothetical protein
LLSQKGSNVISCTIPPPKRVVQRRVKNYFQILNYIPLPVPLSSCAIEKVHKRG